MDAEARVRAAETVLANQDPQLGELIELQKPVFHPPRTNYFFSLCRSIVGQQISVAAAKSVFARLEQATNMDPKLIANLDEASAKQVGLSKQKLSYVRDLAAHFVNDPNVYNHLENLSDEEVIADLTAIKGIGVWTAQMFLMFSLTRLDVFAPDDIGIQRSMQKLYGWKTLPPKAELIRTAEQWRPYRTIACWHLWHSLEKTPR